MKVSEFDFNLPQALIADRPATPRESARLLVVGDELRDQKIADLPDHIRPGDVVVFNNSRVIPARLLGMRGEVSVELLLHQPVSGNGWRAFAKPAKRLKDGQRIDFTEDFYAVVHGRHETGEVNVYFNHDGADLTRMIEAHGHVPLPPYIESKRKADAQDKQDYQTIYARGGNSVAAPTAGLHFTPPLMEAIRAEGAQVAFVTLHVGAGTFQPVKVEDTDDHVMHAELAEVSAETADIINRARAQCGRIIAVGTTSLRTLESACDARGVIQPMHASTSIFITPGYRFKCVDVLMTNFHLPKSTLFMLVSAFAGTERMKAAYAHAIASQYRFYSYGDACLLARAD
jgi:S-adenosylmethionine:tRNA ribosyltransferase-isomerase